MSRKIAPQSDVSELNLGLCSGLPSYIRVKWAPLPRAQQDVAERRNERGKWVFDTIESLTLHMQPRICHRTAARQRTEREAG